jgi:hypothetical protein
MIWYTDWIEQAEYLASKEDGRPKEASLRRSVSTAYYALFHELNRTVANALVGSSTSWETYTPMYRMVDHLAAKEFFKRLQNRGSEDFKLLGAAVAEIGTSFVQLQDERLRADYNPEPYPHRRQDVVELIAQAKDSAVKLDGLSSELKLALAVRLLAKPKRK